MRNPLFLLHLLLRSPAAWHRLGAPHFCSFCDGGIATQSDVTCPTHRVLCPSSHLYTIRINKAKIVCLKKVALRPSLLCRIGDGEKLVRLVLIVCAYNCARLCCTVGGIACGAFLCFGLAHLSDSRGTLTGGYAALERCDLCTCACIHLCYAHLALMRKGHPFAASRELHRVVSD